MIGVDTLLGVGFVVLEVHLKLQTAQRVDLIQRNLRAVAGGDSVSSGSAGERPDAADLDGGGRFPGTGAGGTAAGRGGRRGSAVAAAAGEGSHHGRCKDKAQNFLLFHRNNLL
ncbi:hypothetical protein SDC9_110061 [bioreactor metagenome]|uniref:Uncharacterized protein n=1 Tax=bioreactor metagenome TaxID=1076179 RepID=A0A645BEU6_9ZZZZ